MVGRERLNRWAEAFSHNISGIATNISLGFLLGMTPTIGIFLGIPLDVRHVTLSSGQLALACASLNDAWWNHGWFLKAFLGIATMFILNLGVSFTLSLLTAARAYKLSPTEISHVMTYVIKEFLHRPREFLLPPAK
jgi:site-specific recombinase